MTPTTQDEVIIVDDDLYVQRALRRLLSSSGFATRTFSSAKEFLASKAPAPAGGCMVLDIEMPELNGMELQAQLRQQDIHLPIIFITGHATIQRSVQAMQLGAVDFLEKPVESAALIDAIRRAIALNRRQAAEKQECLDLEQCYESLSLREREVLRLVVAGLLNKQIAAEMGIVEQTVKVHRARMMVKMQASSVAELVSLAEKLRRPPCSSPIFKSLK